MKSKMNRRDFIKKGSSTLVGMGIVLESDFKLRAESTKKSRVVEITHAKAVSAGRKVDVSVVKEMLRKGIKILTNSEKPWSRFIKPNDRVGLKINTLGRPMLFTHHELIQAVAEELVEYGVEENNIIVWDRHETHMKDSNFTFNTSDRGIRCYGTEALDNTQDRFDQEMTYKSDFDDSNKREAGKKISCMSSIFTQECDKIINLAILKDHGYSGVTLCLKNLAFGLCDNNGRFHGPKHIGPFIADFCALPQVRKKVVLHIIDGLEGCFDRGPVPRSLKHIFTPNTLWLGTDPVALDAIGFQTIETERRERARPSLAEDGRPIDHIDLAAKKSVGINSLNQIKVEKIQLG